MSRFKTKQALCDDIVKERQKLEALLGAIPDSEKTVEVTDGMSIKDFLAHRTEWGRMMLSWYAQARKGELPAVPSDMYKWSQLKELNAEVYEKFKDVPLATIEKGFAKVHDELYELVASLDEPDLLEKNHYNFTGTSDLATYLNSATAAHYRSAYKYISK